MNYLTSIIAGPLFFILFLIELAFYLRRTTRNPLHQKLALTFVIVSLLQAASALFWFFGYATSKLNGIMSEGFDEGEEINCFGIVGAEILLAIFQYIMTMVSCLQMVRILQVDVSLRSPIRTSLRNARNIYQIFFYALGVIMFAYTLIAFTTAYNRRCPQAPRKILPELEHYFYPVYLVVDVVLYSITIWKMRKLERVVEESQRHLVTLAPAQSTSPSHRQYSHHKPHGAPAGSVHGANTEFILETDYVSSLDASKTGLSRKEYTNEIRYLYDDPRSDIRSVDNLSHDEYRPSSPPTSYQKYPRFQLTSRLHQGQTMMDDHMSSNYVNSFEMDEFRHTDHNTQTQTQPHKSSSHMSSRMRRQITSLNELTRLHRQQLIVTIAAGIFGVALYIVQFTEHVEALAIVLCCFCMFMYIGYVFRRTPFLMYYTGRRILWIGVSKRGSQSYYSHETLASA
jgi:hypothetical protein